MHCKSTRVIYVLYHNYMVLAGEAILVDNAENLLSAVKKVVEDIQVATIKIKDPSVHERLGLKLVKWNLCIV